MAKRRKSFRGTPAQHTKDAAHYVRRAREDLKRVTRLAQANVCDGALRALNRLAYAHGAAEVSRNYTADRGARTRYASVRRLENAVTRARYKVESCYNNRK
jgi:hypothetical protein